MMLVKYVRYHAGSMYRHIRITVGINILHCILAEMTVDVMFLQKQSLDHKDNT